MEKICRTCKFERLFPSSYPCQQCIDYCYWKAKETKELSDSGKRETLETGAVREPQEDRGRYDLITPHALQRLAIHYERGARKYADRNWEKGIPASRMFSSAVRHLFQWIAGDRKEDHLAAAVWNIFCIMHYEEILPEMIDTPKQEGE